MVALSKSVRKLLGGGAPSAPGESSQVGPGYESRAPSAQNCIDAIPGWNSKFPDEFGVVAGNRVPFDDPRILWAIDRYGSIAGARVLEIGPLEGAHTYVLDCLGADVAAVEASKQAFLKRLVTKEIVGLPRTRFLLGDGLQYLERDETRYDLIVACGVLYHVRDPLRFLEAVAARTDHLYLWTSFLDLKAAPADYLPAIHFRTLHAPHPLERCFSVFARREAILRASPGSGDTAR